MFSFAVKCLLYSVKPTLLFWFWTFKNHFISLLQPIWISTSPQPIKPLSKSDVFHFCIYRKPSGKCPTKITIPRGLLEAGPLPLPSAGSSIERTLYYVHILLGSIFSSFANLLCVLFSVLICTSRIHSAVCLVYQRRRNHKHTQPPHAPTYLHTLFRSSWKARLLPLAYQFQLLFAG